MVDCEKLSPNALEIFKKMERFFPPDPWKNAHWLEDGRLHDNGGWLDVRKSADRTRLEKRLKNSVGTAVELLARRYKEKIGSLDGFEHEHFSLLIKNFLELLLLVTELDFQIETLDLVDW